MSQFLYCIETVNIEKKSFIHVHSVCIHWAADHAVRIVLLLMIVMKSVDYSIQVNCINDLKCKLKTVIPVLKFVTLIQEVFSTSIVTMINTINGKILTLATLQKILISDYF